jgi:hypothetical protein
MLLIHRLFFLVLIYVPVISNSVKTFELKRIELFVT